MQHQIGTGCRKEDQLRQRSHPHGDNNVQRDRPPAPILQRGKPVSDKQNQNRRNHGNGDAQQSVRLPSRES